MLVSAPTDKTLVQVGRMVWWLVLPLLLVSPVSRCQGFFNPDAHEAQHDDEDSKNQDKIKEQKVNDWSDRKEGLDNSNTASDLLFNGE